MVIEGDGKRLALECDGDRYHPIEKLAEDVERQAILERLGWQFVRIRGSAFYRNPERAMEPVFSRLKELGIPPVGIDGEAPSNDMTLIHELAALVNADDEAFDDLDAALESEDALIEHVGVGQTERDAREATAIVSEGPNPAARQSKVESQSTFKEHRTSAEPLFDFEERKGAGSHQRENNAKHDNGTDGVTDLKLLESLAANEWFAIAKWAKQNGHLKPFQRSLAFSLGLLTAKGKQASEKQLKYGALLLEEAQRLGYKLKS